MSSFCKSSVFTRQVLHHCSQSPLHSLSYLQTAPCPWMPVFLVTPVRGGRKPSTRWLCCQVKNWLKQAQPCKLQAPHLHCWLYFGHGQSVAQFQIATFRHEQHSTVLGHTGLKNLSSVVFWVILATWAQVWSNSHGVCLPRLYKPVVWSLQKGIQNVPLHSGALPVPPHEVPLWKRKPICTNLSAAAPVSPHLSLQTWDNTRT